MKAKDLNFIDVRVTYEEFKKLSLRIKRRFYDDCRKRREHTAFIEALDAGDDE